MYLDHAATTPMLPEIVEEMMPYLNERFGNASSLHFYGEEAKRALEESRATIADLINAEPDEIYFTSGGTESDNIAIIGSARDSKRKHVITSAIEHEAVIEPIKYLEKEYGYKADYLRVDEYGIVDLDMLESVVDHNTLLISVMMANNEIGTIEPIKDIVKIAKRHGVLVHTDAVQAIGKIKIDVKELGVDMLSASAHKFYGPKGVGFIYVKRGTPLLNIIFGGGHERGMRSGTENVPGAVGMAAALRYCYENFDALEEKYARWKEKILNTCEEIGDYRLNGHPTNRLVSTLSLGFKGVNGESLMQALSMNGIAVSTGSACSSHSSHRDVSRILRAIGLSEDYAQGTIRVVTGADNTDEQIDYFIQNLSRIVRKLRKMGECRS